MNFKITFLCHFPSANSSIIWEKKHIFSSSKPYINCVQKYSYNSPTEKKKKKCFRLMLNTRKALQSITNTCIWFAWHRRLFQDDSCQCLLVCFYKVRWSSSIFKDWVYARQFVFKRPYTRYELHCFWLKAYLLTLLQLKLLKFIKLNRSFWKF